MICKQWTIDQWRAQIVYHYGFEWYADQEKRRSNLKHRSSRINADQADHAEQMQI